MEVKSLSPKESIASLVPGDFIILNPSVASLPYHQGEFYDFLKYYLILGVESYAVREDQAISNELELSITVFQLNYNSNIDASVFNIHTLHFVSSQNFSKQVLDVISC